MLKARLFALERERAAAARSELRSSVAGTGDRSDKVRTYNFPQVSAERHALKADRYTRLLRRLLPEHHPPTPPTSD